MKRIRTALLAVLLLACQSKADPHVAALVGTQRINSEVTLTHIRPEPVDPDLKGEYWVVLTNQSRNRYMFPADFGIRILVYSEKDGAWREAQNLSTYLPPDASIVLQPKGNWPEDEVPFSFWPMFEQRLDDSKLRVIVSGHDEDGEAVAAFIDIPLGE